MLQPHLDADFDSLDEYWFGSPDSKLDSPPGPPEPPSSDERRRLRRKISNRESARRCRMRKQRRLEELRSESARLTSANQDIARRVVALSHRCQLFRSENLRLRAESAALARSLSELHRFILLLRQLSQAAPHLFAFRGSLGIINDANGTPKGPPLTYHSAMIDPIRPLV